MVEPATLSVNSEKRLSMRKAFRGFGVIFLASIWFAHPGSAYTQAECDQLKKVQSDPAGREIDEKMKADAQGNCKPEPPNAKEATAPVERQAPRSQAVRWNRLRPSPTPARRRGPGDLRPALVPLAQSECAACLPSSPGQADTSLARGRGCALRPKTQASIGNGWWSWAGLCGHGGCPKPVRPPAHDNLVPGPAARPSSATAVGSAGCAPRDQRRRFNSTHRSDAGHTAGWILA